MSFSDPKKITEIEIKNQLQLLADMHDVLHNGFHQCNNHLAIILTNCDLMMMMDPNPQTEKKIESIKEKATNIAHTLRAIYTYARMQVAAPVETIKLKSFCEHTLNTFSYPTEDYQVETAVNIDAGLEIRTIPGFLEQILKTFLQNAIESLATTNVRKLDIDCKIEKEQTVLTVKDSGPAIDADVLAKLFKPFFTTKKEHLGLGLAQARTLAKFINADIQYERINDMNYISLILEKDGTDCA